MYKTKYKNNQNDVNNDCTYIAKCLNVNVTTGLLGELFAKNQLPPQSKEAKHKFIHNAVRIVTNN